MIRPLASLAGAMALVGAAPVSAQDHSRHGRPSTTQPAPSKPERKAARPRPQRSTPRPRATPKPAPQDMQGMDHSLHQPGAMPGMSDGNRVQPSSEAMPGVDHRRHRDGAMPDMSDGEMTGTALSAGDAPPPPVPSDHFADRAFPAGEMARSREIMMKESGGGTFGQVLLDLFEYQAHGGRDGYRWDGEGFYGGDVGRLWLRSEGEGEFGRGVDAAEAQMLYSHAIDPYFNLQAGVRQDFGRGPDRTYATVGFEGLAPGLFEVEGALFLSDKGDLLGRVEGYYDQRITQRLILQPRAELNFAAQDLPENDIGSGLVDIELGARLRYEISRQFAPYVGVSYLRKTGATARLSRLAGEGVHATSFVAGVRFWF